MASPFLGVERPRRPVLSAEVSRWCSVRSTFHPRSIAPRAQSVWPGSPRRFRPDSEFQRGLWLQGRKPVLGRSGDRAVVLLQASTGRPLARTRMFRRLSGASAARTLGRDRAARPAETSASQFPPYQSEHHSPTFPCRSYRPRRSHCYRVESFAPIRRPSSPWRPPRLGLPWVMPWVKPPVAAGPCHHLPVWRLR